MSTAVHEGMAWRATLQRTTVDPGPAWSDPAGPAGRRQWRELLASYTMNARTGLYVGWADGDQETGRGGTSLFAKVSHGFAF